MLVDIHMTVHHNLYGKGEVIKVEDDMRTRSVPNRTMYWCLDSLNISFEDEAFFEWSDLKEGRKVYDFFLPDYSCIIEMHGAQHYIESTNFSGKTLSEIPGMT